jgi:uncharacterized protein (TIGR02145 family)
MKILAGIVVLITLSIFSCAEDDGPEYPCSFCIKSSSSSTTISSSSFSGVICDAGVVYGDPVMYGEEVYETIVICEQTWFKRNLNYDPGSGDSKCYFNSPENCSKYGRLYDFETANNVCPPGWHLPSYYDWNILINSIGGINIAGTKLKSADGCLDGIGNGSDDYGFSALLGSHGYSDGTFRYGLGIDGFWWSASDHTSNTAYGVHLSCEYSRIYFGHDGIGYDTKSYLFSVRCLKD